MAISNASSNLRPGVCTSSTRPSAPYEGQVIYETDTNRVLVWDNSAWVMIADTDSPPGLQLIGDVGCSSGGTASNGVVTVGTSVSSVTITNAFSSDFTNYRIHYTNYTSSIAEPLKMRLGTTSTGYYGSFSYSQYNTTGQATVNDSNQSFFRYVGSGWTDGGSDMVVDVINPNAATRTFIRSCLVNYSTALGDYQGFADNSTQYTSFSLHGFSTGTFTGGTIRVYGYRNQL